MNVAQLKYEIDSSKAVSAKTNLSGMSRAARDAEKAQKGLGSTSSRAGREIVAANTNISRSTGVVTKAYSAMRVAGLAAIVGITAGLVGITSLLGRFVSASVESQKVQAQLAAAINSTGGAAGQTLASLNAHAAALQKVTTFGDEVTNSAQGVLLTFTKIRGDVFPRATEAVQDLAQALGQSLQGAAIQVGKALNDPATGLTLLTRSGITFSEAQKAVIKDLVATNRLAEAQGVILGELETQFGGSARAMRGTLGGAISALSNAWGDLFEKTGAGSNVLRLAIESLITAISDPAFVSFMQVFGSALFGALTVAATAAKGLSVAFGVLTSNIDTIGVAAGTAGTLLLVAFGPAILSSIASGFVAMGTAGVAAISAITAAMAANPLGALAVAITASITALYVFRDEVEKAIGVDVVGIARTAANYVIGSFVAAYHDIEFLWKNFPDVIGAAAIGAANATIGAVESMINSVIGGINNLINDVKMKMLELGKPINVGFISSADFGVFKNPAADRLAGAATTLGAQRDKDLNTDYLGKIGAAFEVSTPAAQNFAGALAAVNDNLSGSSKAAEQLADKYKDIVAGAHQFIAAQELERDVIGMTERAANALRYQQDLLNKAQSAGINLTADQKAELVGLANQMAATEAQTSLLKQAFDFAKGAAKGFLSDLRTALINGEGLWKSFGNAAIGVLNKIISKIEDQLVDALFSASSAGSGVMGGGGGGIFGSIIGGIGKLLGFANGTNYAPGGMAMVGERGPELVELPRGSRVNTASETRRMFAPANQSRVQAVHVTVGWEQGSNGNIAPIIKRVSGEMAARVVVAAAPGIIDRSTAASGSALGRGDFDQSMSKFGASRQARTR